MNATKQAIQRPDVQRQQYLMLLELSKAIASHRNLVDLCHDLAGRLPQLFDFHSLCVMLHDAARNVMRLAHRGDQ